MKGGRSVRGGKGSGLSDNASGVFLMAEMITLSFIADRRQDNLIGE